MIDLRSDTVTRPTRVMRRAMAGVAVGDDVFGEDPTVNRLEEYVAALLGKEAALYCPSGTMTNQIGVHVATGRGDEIVLHEDAHIVNYEAGAPVLLSGVQVRPVPGAKGVVSTEALRAAVRPENVHFPRPKLLRLENTHNPAGGKVFPLERFAEVVAEAQSLGLKVHLDGAWLFNAQVATGISVREWCEHADTVCSSKGLGVPIGSLPAGDEASICEARRVRKAFGGRMRQAGVVAVASLYAFEYHVARLAEDHERARRLATGLVEVGYKVEPPETNIVLVEVGEAVGFLRALTREGVLATPRNKVAIRLCTHLDVEDEDVDAAVEVAARLTVHSLKR